ncbi:MAG: hypothetical protein R3F55_17775 [Alphaproteobacteria bacterium]
MVILSGMGRLAGAVLGAALFLLLEDVLPGLLDLFGDGWGQRGWRWGQSDLVVLFARGSIARAGRGRLARSPRR